MNCENSIHCLIVEDSTQSDSGGHIIVDNAALILEPDVQLVAANRIKVLRLKDCIIFPINGSADATKRIVDRPWKLNISRLYTWNVSLDVGIVNTKSNDSLFLHQAQSSNMFEACRESTMLSGQLSVNSSPIIGFNPNPHPKVNAPPLQCVSALPHHVETQFASGMSLFAS